MFYVPGLDCIHDYILVFVKLLFGNQNVDNDVGIVVSFYQVMFCVS